MVDQPANTQLSATNTLQQLNYQTPSYHIASQHANRPNRWKRWIGWNIVAFIVASAVLFGCVMCIFMFYLKLDQMNVPFNLDWINKPRRHPIFSVGIPGVLVGLSAMVGSITQRNGLYKLVSFWPWILKTGLITTFISWVNLAIFIFMIEPLSLFSKNTSLSIMLYFIASIGFTVFATALAQLTEVKKIVHQPNDWVKITVLTWTCIACILGGCTYIIW